MGGFAVRGFAMTGILSEINSLNGFPGEACVLDHFSRLAALTMISGVINLIHVDLFKDSRTPGGVSMQQTVTRKKDNRKPRPFLPAFGSVMRDWPFKKKTFEPKGDAPSLQMIHDVLLVVESLAAILAFEHCNPRVHITHMVPKVVDRLEYSPTMHAETWQRYWRCLVLIGCATRIFMSCAVYFARECVTTKRAHPRPFIRKCSFRVNIHVLVPPFE